MPSAVCFGFGPLGINGVFTASNLLHTVVGNVASLTQLNPLIPADCLTAMLALDPAAYLIPDKVSRDAGWQDDDGEPVDALHFPFGLRHRPTLCLNLCPLRSHDLCNRGLVVRHCVFCFARHLTPSAISPLRNIRGSKSKSNAYYRMTHYFSMTHY